MKKLLLVALFFAVSINFNSVRALNAPSLVTNSAIIFAFASAFSNVSNSEELPKIFALMAGSFLLTHPLVSSHFSSKSVNVQPINNNNQNNINIHVPNPNQLQRQTMPMPFQRINSRTSSFGSQAFDSLTSYFSFDTAWRSALFAGGIYTLGMSCKMLGNYARGGESFV